MTTLEIQVPDQKAKNYKALFQSLAKRDMTWEDIEDMLLGIKMEEVSSDNLEDYIHQENFSEVYEGRNITSYTQRPT